jgi:hypothetical protein
MKCDTDFDASELPSVVPLLKFEREGKNSKVVSVAA